MIYIRVDQSYAYDMLAILTIKQRISSNPEGVAAQARLEDDLTSEIGMSLHEEIMWSSEFKALLWINQQLFDLINEIKSRAPRLDDALAVDGFNYARFKAKEDLQKRFFPDTPLTERKVGYKEDKT